MDLRQEMLETVAANFRDTHRSTGLREMNPRVQEAMARVPREAFVPLLDRGKAYWNKALPIGHGQTISQPFIVALMTELLEPEPDDRVLEVGCGSGYQAAILAQLVEKVYSVEILETLAKSAVKRLDEQGCDNVELRCGDGYHGWPEHSPYDGILVAAAAPDVPPDLVEQLAPGAHLVLPIRTGEMRQELVRVTREVGGGSRERRILGVTFVALTGDHG